MRQALEGDVAYPFVVVGVARDGRRSVAPLSNRDPRRRVVADVAVHVGVDHVLLGTGEATEGVLELLPVLRLVHLQERKVKGVRLKRGPRERQRVFAVLADHRAVASGPDRKAHVYCGAHVDVLLVHFGVNPAALHQVFVRVAGVERLEVQVLDVGAGVGHSPRDPVVVTDDHEGSAGQADAGHVQTRRLELNLVPDAGHAVAQMRVVREQRLARLRVRATDHPVVAAQRQIEVVGWLGQ